MSDYPVEKKMSDKVSVRLGFRDGHIEIRVKVPLLPGRIPLRIEPDDIPAGRDILETAEKWLQLPDEEKARLSDE